MIAVVIPVRNGAATLGAQLTALAAQDVVGRWRVYVADNGSTDATVDVARSFATRLPLTIVAAGTSPGVNRARNTGTAAAIADGAATVLFCDADDEVELGWVAAMAAAAAHFDVWGCPLDRTRLGDARRLRKDAVRTTGLHQWPGHLRAASGAALGCRAAAWTAVGGFDEAFRGGNDDVDFCWRVQGRGGVIGFVPDTCLHYRERADDWAVFRQFRGYGLRDPLLFRRHRANGMPRQSTVAALRTWAWLALHLPDAVRAGERRSVWVRVLGRRWGRLLGCVRYRVWYP